MPDEKSKPEKGQKKVTTSRRKPKIPKPLEMDVDESIKNTTRQQEEPDLAPRQIKVYQLALKSLNENQVNYAVGASFARFAYTSIWRPTKDLDIFVTPENLRAALDALDKAGFRTVIEEEHWLSKAWKGEYFVDIIFGQAHGYSKITDASFKGSRKAEVLGVETRLIPIEEMIASAAYVATRGRFDGGDIVHLILRTKGKLDWQRILTRLKDNRELLLWHLILFDYVYPGHSDYLPKDLMVELFGEVRERWINGKGKKKLFRGTLLDPFAYNVDIEDWGYEDRRRLEPLVDEEGELL